RLRRGLQAAPAAGRPAAHSELRPPRDVREGGRVRRRGGPVLPLTARPRGPFEILSAPIHRRFGTFGSLSPWGWWHPYQTYQSADKSAHSKPKVERPGTRVPGRSILPCHRGSAHQLADRRRLDEVLRPAGRVGHGGGRRVDAEVVVQRGV